VPQLAAGWSIEQVSGIAILLPTGSWYIEWTLNLVTFYQQFMRAGIVLSPESEGGKFYHGLMAILARHENLRPEQYSNDTPLHDPTLRRELFEFFESQAGFCGQAPGS
jgi:hypothetical protein